MSITPREESAKEAASQQGPGELGLLANGSSRLWDVAVNESLEREGEWWLELDGRTVYLVFRLRDLAVIPEAVAFFGSALNPAPTLNGPQRSDDDDSLTLGTFGTLPVWILRDDETPPRCFLVVDSDTVSAMRLALQQEDIEMLLAAFQQVAEDLRRGET
jgi:hypothetical protein